MRLTTKQMYEKLQAACDQLAASLQNEAPPATLRENLSQASANYVVVMMDIDNELQTRINEGK